MEMHDRFEVPLTGPLTTEQATHAYRVVHRRSNSGKLTHAEAMAERAEVREIVRARVDPEVLPYLFSRIHLTMFGFARNTADRPMPEDDDDDDV